MHDACINYFPILNSCVKNAMLKILKKFMKESHHNFSQFSLFVSNTPQQLLRFLKKLDFRK